MPLARYGVMSPYHGRCGWVLNLTRGWSLWMELDLWRTLRGCGVTRCNWGWWVFLPCGSAQLQFPPLWECSLLFPPLWDWLSFISTLRGARDVYYSSLRGALNSTGVMIRIGIQLNDQDNNEWHNTPISIKHSLVLLHFPCMLLDFIHSYNCFIVSM